ncbi:MAG: enolase C-terminal domain-like protein [Lentisphaeria bacterium]
MSNPYDAQIADVACYLLPITFRVPLKFGHQVMREAWCARVCIRLRGTDGRVAEGWGETPYSIGWAWPSDLPYAEREKAMNDFAAALATDLKGFETSGHAMEIGEAYQRQRLTALRESFEQANGVRLPYLAALVALSPFDVALYDAYGKLHDVDVYTTCNAQYMNDDLAAYLTPAEGEHCSFEGKYPEDYFGEYIEKVPAWHLVGGLDPLSEDELTSDEPDDGYPVLLRDWIRTDGLKCLKVKLRGNDAEWDYDRLVKVGQIGLEEGVTELTADFNCTVEDPEYVNGIVDRLEAEHPALFDQLLYIEQPFPYDLEANRIDVHSVSQRKPLFLDESAHDWKIVRLGRSLGWTGVALKTCKTQTGALLSLCWAKAHGMQLMVQDLTNPMLAQIPHVLLAAHAGTIMGVESNSMQFYPAASKPEEAVHPGLYKRRDGVLDLASVRGAGFGYRLEEIQRDLPAPVVDFET